MITHPGNLMQKSDTQDLFGLPVDTTVAFSNHKGIYKRRIEKQQRKLLKKLAFLPPFLEQDEKILYVAAGCSPISLLEQLLTGAIIYHLKRCLFVFTNKRILHIPTKSNLAYRKSIAQILYADCSALQIKRSKLVAEYKNGRTEKFPAISGKARKKVTELLKGLFFEGQTSPMLERAHLCPRCTKPLVKGFYTCPHCSLEFKNKVKARRLSVIFPGGGYFYTRNTALGIMDALGETLLSVVLLVALVNTIAGDPEAVGALGFIAAVLAFEKLVTIFHANRFVEEFIPVDRQVTAQPGLETTTANQPKPEEMPCAGWRSR